MLGTMDDLFSNNEDEKSFGQNNIFNLSSSMYITKALFAELNQTKVLHRKPKNILGKILKEFNDFSDGSSMIKRVFSMPNLTHRNVDIKKKSNNPNNLNDIQENNFENNIIIEPNINNNIQKNNINIEEEIQFQKKKTLRHHSFSKKKEMSSNYSEEIETITQNILINNT